ncbi:FEKKY domain-containing protein [Ferruginibacter sp.]
MRQLLLIFGLLSSLHSSRQVTHDSLSLDPGKLVLYCGKGYEVKILDKTDQLFQKQFKVSYIISSCIPTLPIETMVALNNATAKLLDKKYGVDWRLKLRNDVFGLTK